MVDDGLEGGAGLSEIGALRELGRGQYDRRAVDRKGLSKKRTALTSRSETWKVSETRKSTPKISKAFGRA